ncbi:MAG: DsrE family protein [Desulfarculaceae bacterium]|nr:DsrE family protein [Desulfarculaceae bacterium]MCF8071554.1 DsrE family protein [Desulfarculaceae bacterium]MCF8102369.1 DsrE family protein [Desulfarculaceae bacterium]MCF8114833.1 DsrE family protein [Desulfarculaceae bacterium]
MSEQTEKIVYIATHGGENPEKASLPFVLANAALAMEVEAVVALQGTAVTLAKEGCLQHIFAAGLPPLKQLVDSFLEQGGRLMVCVPCIRERKLEESELIEGIELMAAAKLTQELLSANATLVY